MKKLLLLFTLILSAVTAQAQSAGGYRGFVEIGHNFGHPIKVKEETEYNAFATYRYSNSLFLSTTQGYQFSPLFFIGGGAGVQLWKARHNDYDSSGNLHYHYVDTSLLMWTGFVEARFDFPAVTRISFFETNKIGVAGGDCTSFYFFPAVGVKYQINYSIGLNLSLGYQLGQKTTWYVQGEETIYGPTLNCFALSLGIDFQP